MLLWPLYWRSLSDAPPLVRFGHCYRCHAPRFSFSSSWRTFVVLANGATTSSSRSSSQTRKHNKFHWHPRFEQQQQQQLKKQTKGGNMISRTVLICLLIWATIGSSSSLDNGLALTPPMGWLSWERFVCETDCLKYPGECIDANLFREMAKRLVQDGYKQLGYEYVNIDDCWSTKQRDNSTSRLVPDPARFPSIFELSKELQTMGLKLGIYGDCGTETCQLFPGQLKYKDNLTGNYFELDATTFSQWQIDSFKFDGCALNVSQAAKICPLMGDALNATRRPILFSCSWPAYENDEHLATNWSLVVEKCNLWRAFGDIEDSWRSVLETIDYFVAQQDLVAKYHGPGHWFDADQLIIGDFGLSWQQERAQMAIWCVWASPLYMSNDLRSISKDSREILQNNWLIQVNQDPMGVFGLMVGSSRYLQAFVKPVEPIIEGCPSYAIVYLDRRTLGNGRYGSFRLLELLTTLHDKLALADPPKWSHWLKCTGSKEASFSVYDLYDDFARINRNVGLVSDSLVLRTNPSGVRMVKLIRNEKEENLRLIEFTY